MIEVTNITEEQIIDSIEAEGLEAFFDRQEAREELEDIEAVEVDLGLQF